jgi:hypothetical protein
LNDKICALKIVVLYGFKESARHLYRNLPTRRKKYGYSQIKVYECKFHTNNSETIVGIKAGIIIGDHTSFINNTRKEYNFKECVKT